MEFESVDRDWPTETGDGIMNLRTQRGSFVATSATDRDSMDSAQIYRPGGYRFIPGVFQYSAGVAAEIGYEIHRINFIQLPNLVDGFAAIARHLSSLGLPLQSLCQCELRSPAPFTDEEFLTFNRGYVETLERWGIIQDGANPVARSNLCPRVAPPREPSLFSFSYTVPQSTNLMSTFAIAGCGEAPEGKANYRDHIIRRGEVSQSALLEKGGFVLNEQSRRLKTLSFDWSQVTAINVYTVHHLSQQIIDEIRQRTVATRGLTWYDCRPPVVDIEFEMDCRCVAQESYL